MAHMTQTEKPSRWQRMRENARARNEKIEREWAYASYEFWTVRRDELTHSAGERHPLLGASARIIAGSEIDRRVTATRLVAIGVLAFAAKKKSGGESWLYVEGPDWQFVLEVPRDKISEAAKFASAVNSGAQRAANRAGTLS